MKMEVPKQISISLYPDQRAKVNRICSLYDVPFTRVIRQIVDELDEKNFNLKPYESTAKKD
jgi:hypothetical protein